MKNFIILILITPILIFCQITEDLIKIEQPIKKFYLKGAFVPGLSFETITVGEKYYQYSDKESEEIFIEPGGGSGSFEGVIGYDISKLITLEISAGIQNSGESVDDFKVKFKKFLIRASILYKMPIDKYYVPYIGVGISRVITGKYIEKSYDFVESEVIYKNPSGFHLLIGAEMKDPDFGLNLYGEIRLVMLGEFEMEESNIDEWILKDIGLDKMNANGLHFCIGIGYYLF
ncbi:hypothetical protein ACFL0J_06035 [Candidatus Neomarinimicrobiota bacterium]